MRNVILKTRVYKILFFLISILGLGLHIPFIHAQEIDVIRVGYTPESGFMNKKDGIYSGYVYDYLREIAIYTGWDYEFIEMSLEDALDALKKGEIDLFPGLEKNEDNITDYDFTENYAGYTYTTLAVLRNNTYFNRSTYILLDDLRVGYSETQENMLKPFQKMCEQSEVETIHLLPYQTNTLLLNKLNAQEIDIMISGDQLIGANIKVISNFNPKPYYFATTKNNTEIVQAIDDALFKIDQKNANFAKETYRKFFQDSDHNTLILSKRQADLVKVLRPLKVVYISNYIPIQYYDEENNEHRGIFVDVIRLLSHKTDIPVEFIPVDTYEKAYAMLKNEEADLIAGLMDDYQIADSNNFELSKHYLKFNLEKAVNKQLINQVEKEIFALPIGHGYMELEGDYEIHKYNTLAECLEAVDQGRATTTYGNSYSMSNHLASQFYQNLYVITNYNEVRIVVGISKELHPQVVKIINQAVYSLSDEEISKIVDDNTYEIERSISLRDFFIYNMEECSLVLLIFIVVVSVLIYIIVKMRFDQIKAIQSVLFEKTQIDSLTGLYNREACERLVTEHLQDKDGTSLDAFIIIDIDYFKQINDQFGHKIGDQLLIDFGDILRESFGQQDIISRLGGDEFIVFMKDINEKIVTQKLSILCERMNQNIEYNGKNQAISLSIGMIITKKTRSFNTLYMRADEVLYEVKHEGKNGFKVKEI